MKASDVARLARDLMLEQEWQDDHVIPYARAQGWWVYHPFDSRKSPEGWPDLTLLRERVVFAELKRQKGKVTLEQQTCVEALRAAGAEVYIWRPSDWEEVVRCLAR